MLCPKLNPLVVMLICLTLMVTGIAVAAPLELLTHGSSGFINEALFVQVDPDNSTGTGVIQPFLHIQKNGVEEGYNTDYKPREFPDANSPWTKSLLLSDVPVVKVNNVNYREFFLDINENTGGTNEFLSLDKLQIFLGSAGNLTNYPTGLGTLIWDMDAGNEGDTFIKLDYSLESGSGSGDMIAYIPDNLFVSGGPYVYLYSKFGEEVANLDGYDCSDGFEEWAVREAAVPEPSSMLAFCTGLISMIGVATRKSRK